MEQVDFLKDVNRDGKERPWKQKKEQSLKMAAAYQEAGLHRKATRMCQCGEVLEFKRTDNGLKLANAYFCKVRLCPMCMWRRSLKLVNQNTRIIERANEKQKLRWVFGMGKNLCLEKVIGLLLLLQNYFIDMECQ